MRPACLFQQLAADTVIVRLGLSGIRSRWLPIDTFSTYFSSLAHNTRIEELDLSNAELDDDDACALACALMGNRSIRTLAFSGCIIPDKGRAALANVLSKKPDIRASGFSVGPVPPQSITAGTANTANAATTSTATPPVNGGTSPATDRSVVQFLARGTVASPSAHEQGLADDQLTARLAMGRMAPRSSRSTALCHFFNSLPAGTKLFQLRLRGAVLSRAETLALAEGLRLNKSIQEIDLRGCMPDPGVRDRLIEALNERSDLEVIL